MNRRYAGLLLLPVSIFLMTLPATSRNQPPKSAKRAEADSQSSASAVPPLTAEQKRWVESTMHQMTLEEKVGQILFATYHGAFTATDSAAYAQILHSVEDLHVGGFINVTHGSPLGFLKSQAYPTAVLNNQLQSKS